MKHEIWIEEQYNSLDDVVTLWTCCIKYNGMLATDTEHDWLRKHGKKKKMAGGKKSEAYKRNDKGRQVIGCCNGEDLCNFCMGG